MSEIIYTVFRRLILLIVFVIISKFLTKILMYFYEFDKSNLEQNLYIISGVVFIILIIYDNICKSKK
jgi:hypothetical protein